MDAGCCYPVYLTVLVALWWVGAVDPQFTTRAAGSCSRMHCCCSWFPPVGTTTTCAIGRLLSGAGKPVGCAGLEAAADRVVVPGGGTYTAGRTTTTTASVDGV